MEKKLIPSAMGLFLIATSILYSCSNKKDEGGNFTPASVTTSTVSNITSNSAICGGDVIYDGGSAVVARGVVWSTESNPTVRLLTRTLDDGGTGTFTSTITGLSPNTMYYVRAYAVNGIDTYYGNQQTFTTSTPPLPSVSVTTSEVLSITNNDAICGGNVTSDNGGKVIAKGIVWSTEPSPTVELTTKTYEGGGTGEFTSTMTNLTFNARYYVRAYATTTKDTTIYGNEEMFISNSEPPAQADCFYFTAVEAGAEISMQKEDDEAPEVSLFYSKNGILWHDFEVGVTKVTLVNTDDTVWFRAKDKNAAFGFNSSNYFSATKKVNVGGNILYLLNGHNPPALLSEANNNAFKKLFINCPIIDAQNLILPAVQLANYCCQEMFEGCTFLKTAPELPAMNLADYCYYQMFEGCTSLTTAPELPAMNLADYCYRYMFYGCTSLTTAPELPATQLATYCYSDMFSGCTSLTTAPELPATQLAHFCYYQMFDGCTSLTTAPELPATQLAKHCYQSMFSGCTSLTTAPELPATQLKDYCYACMFLGCTSLTTAPELPATQLAEYCYYQMFEGCTSLTTAPELPVTPLADYCYAYMFERCKKLSHVKMLATDVSANNCLLSWLLFSGDKASSRTLTVAPGMSSNPTILANTPHGTATDSWTIVEQK